MRDISVITVVKDHAIGLQLTFESLLNQTFTNWEMIIVVADSSDGTLPLARQLQDKEPRVRLIEQNGKGIYQAMNEGIGFSEGIYTWFMNAGDKFASPEVVSNALNQFTNPELGLILGSHKIAGSHRSFINGHREGSIAALSFAFNRRGGCHQAMIFRTETLKNLGGYDVSYALASDFDLVLRVIQESQARKVSEIYTSIEPGGIADRQIFQVHREKHQIRQRLLGGWFVFSASLVWTFLARVKILLRRIYS